MSTVYIFDWILSCSYTNVLIKQCSVPIKNIIFIGHSLGAHISGFAAKEVAKNNNENKIPLTANPLFSHKECKARLCKSDAEREEVFHTSLTFGMWGPVGDRDFFFNDGKMQPGCGKRSVAPNYCLWRNVKCWLEWQGRSDKIKQICILDILKMASCSHSRSVEYLIEMMEDIDCGFPAVLKT